VPPGFDVNVSRCGPQCETLLREFQHAEGLTVDGQWGPQTEHAMEVFLHPPDPPKETDPRKKYLAEWWWAHTADQVYRNLHGVTGFPYVAARPYSSLSYWQYHHQPMAGYDCSSSVIAAAHRAGRLDPSGEAFNGSGNTQTMMDHLPHRATISDCVHGDLLVFAGPMDLQHVVTVAAPDGENPTVFSHGSPGVGLWPLAYEIPAHRFQAIIPLRFGP
jgi:hypothetical protein